MSFKESFDSFWLTMVILLKKVIRLAVFYHKTRCFLFKPIRLKETNQSDDK
jgi:hypothetical protein